MNEGSDGSITYKLKSQQISLKKGVKRFIIVSWVVREMIVSVAGEKSELSWRAEIYWSPKIMAEHYLQTQRGFLWWFLLFLWEEMPEHSYIQTTYVVNIQILEQKAFTLVRWLSKNSFVRYSYLILKQISELLSASPLWSQPGTVLGLNIWCFVQSSSIFSKVQSRNESNEFQIASQISVSKVCLYFYHLRNQTYLLIF